VAKLLANLGVSPDHLTWSGLLASMIAGALVAYGRFQLAALALLLGALLDVLDGSVARASDRTSRFGAFLDSTVDRITEMFFFAGLLVYFITIESSTLYVVLTFFAAGGSFLVSYTRARAEGLGIKCEVGVMERPERLVLLLVATLIGAPAIRIALWILTVLVAWTSLQRMHHVWKETQSS
jgi:CDP-diacylglycerol--glycerol-3-phosphate 3-phosphatidyltransferase